MPIRKRPWQVLRIAASDPSSRSYFTQSEAIAGAMAWCLEIGPGDRPIAEIHNKETSGGGSHSAQHRPEADEEDRQRLQSQTFRVQYDKAGTVLMIGTWPVMTAEESDAHTRWAITAHKSPDSEATRPRGGPTWQPVADFLAQTRT